jgi:glutathione S-transferase
MKLYTYDAAPNARRLQLVLDYKGITIEDVQQVDLGTREQLGEDYLAINPWGTVPALVLDDGTLFTEVVGIAAYLDGVYPDKPLMGSDPVESAEIISWDHRLFMYMTQPVADVLRNSKDNWKNRALPGPIDVPQEEALVQRGRDRLASFYPIIDQHLATRPYVAGDRLSFADIDLYTACGFARWIKQGIPEECGNLQAWFDKVAAELGE